MCHNKFSVSLLENKSTQSLAFKWHLLLAFQSLLNDIAKGQYEKRGFHGVIIDIKRNFSKPK